MCRADILPFTLFYQIKSAEVMDWLVRQLKRLKSEKKGINSHVYMSYKQSLFLLFQRTQYAKK